MIQGMIVRPLPALIAQVYVSTWMDGRRLDAYLKVLLSGKAKVNREKFIDYFSQAVLLMNFCHRGVK